MQKGVNLDFELNGAMASLGSVLVYEALLINSLFVLRSCTTSVSISTASVVVGDTPSSAPSSEISKAYSNILAAVHDKDVLVCHAHLGHLSFPAIKCLPNTVRGIQYHARIPSTCACKACIMGKMFRKPFKPLCLEDKAKIRHLRLIHADVIKSMEIQPMHGYRYHIPFTDV